MKRLDLIISALDRVDTFDWNQQDSKLIKDARIAARELRELEPVAKVVLTEIIGLPLLHWLDLDRQFDFKGGEFLYTAPPRKEWVSLTDEEIEIIVDLQTSDDAGYDIFCDGESVAREVMNRLKEKNNA